MNGITTEAVPSSWIEALGGLSICSMCSVPPCFWAWAGVHKRSVSTKAVASRATPSPRPSPPRGRGRRESPLPLGGEGWVRGLRGRLIGRSVQSIKPLRPARHHLPHGLFRQPLEILPHHRGRTRKKAVGMRIIRRPQDLVRPDIVGEHLEAAFHRLERDPTIALEQLAGPHRQAGIIETLIN